MQGNAFLGSDLAAECAVCEGSGIRIRRSSAQGCEITHVRVESAQAAERIGKPQGRYVTVDCGNVCELDEQEEQRVARVLSVEIRELSQKMCARRVGNDFFVLVVGLGNAEMTPDSLGPKTLKTLPVTRRFRGEVGEIGAFSRCDLAALAPGVMAQTGLDTVQILRGVVESVRPDLVIAVDALAARSPARLAATVQLSDSGIQPGGGIGNARRALTRESVGVPVMALGVPTVINCATLLNDLMGKQMPMDQESIERARALFVCPKEIDLLVGRAAALLGKAISRAFCI